MARASPAPIIQTMTELARPAAAEAAPTPTSLSSSGPRRSSGPNSAACERSPRCCSLLMAGVLSPTAASAAGLGLGADLGAFAEAGMVGACADWFAVVALFRCPLGLPIPHTAVVPENKRRIGPALGRFITNNFLSPRVAIARLSSVDAVGLAARWLEDDRNARAIAAGAARAIPLCARPPAESGDRGVGLPEAARRGIEAVPAAPLASRVLSILWAQGRARRCSTRASISRKARSKRNKATIVRHVSQILRFHPQMGRRHDRRQGDQRAVDDPERDARPRPSVARRGQ